MFIIVVFWLGCDRPSGLLFFRARFAFFQSHTSLLTSFICFCILFHSWCSHARVFGKTLVHEFPMSYSHTEWYLPFSRGEIVYRLRLRLSQSNLTNYYYYYYLWILPVISLHWEALLPCFDLFHSVLIRQLVSLTFLPCYTPVIGAACRALTRQFSSQSYIRLFLFYFSHSFVSPELSLRLNKKYIFNICQQTFYIYIYKNK